MQRLCLFSHSKRWGGPGWLCQVPISQGATESRGGCSGLSHVMGPSLGLASQCTSLGRTLVHGGHSGSLKG